MVMLNVLMNGVLAAVFIFLNTWSLGNQLEETFVSLAVIYSLAVILGNSLYISLFLNR